jgi:transposase-like protein
VVLNQVQSAKCKVQSEETCRFYFGFGIDIPVQRRRTQEAIEIFLRRLLEGHQYQPRVVLTDSLASHPPAMRRVLPQTEHRHHKGVNHRAEHAHRPIEGPTRWRLPLHSAGAGVQ